PHGIRQLCSAAWWRSSFSRHLLSCVPCLRRFAVAARPPCAGPSCRRTWTPLPADDVDTSTSSLLVVLWFARLDDGPRDCGGLRSQSSIGEFHQRWEKSGTELPAAKQRL